MRRYTYPRSSDGSPGAEGLSGLAKAFFYAGSQTLLVSHWAVPSEGAKRLTTGMFAAQDKDPAVLMYVRFPLSLRQVEDLLHERGIDICYETVRLCQVTEGGT